MNPLALLFFSTDKMWLAPEYLRNSDCPRSKEGDIYSAGIIMQEIMTRSGPFENERLHMRVEGEMAVLRVYFIFIS